VIPYLAKLAASFGFQRAVILALSNFELIEAARVLISIDQSQGGYAIEAQRALQLMADRAQDPGLRQYIRSAL
jgi:hypothetical protein